jgi:two-component system OmpR family sensor kinase
VEDDGPGIDPHFLPRAFEKFEKHSSSSGTGLGLYMARLMVEALDGSISVSTSPSGTTFQIAVPAVVRSRVRERV